MKRYIITILAALASVCACEKAEIAPAIPESPAVDEGRTVTVQASQTKTAIETMEGGYTFTWKTDDLIALFEYIYENHGSLLEDAYADNIFYSEMLASDTDEASFTVDLDMSLANPNDGKYHYVAVYPCDYYNTYWSADESDDYNSLWADMDGAAATPAHPIICAQFPITQYPSATSFDPAADLLVSQPSVLDERVSGSISLPFTRIGAIAKITLSGLPAGEKIESGYILFGDSYKVYGDIEYDPDLAAARFRESDSTTYLQESMWGSVSLDTKSAVEFIPDEVYADGDGKADIWLRLPEGTVTDSFSIRVWTQEYSQGSASGVIHSYTKSVDLASQERQLRFKNGRLTKFNVSTNEAPYLNLSYTYTNTLGVEETTEDNGYSLYISELPAEAGQLAIHIDTNADPSDIGFDMTNCDWTSCSLDQGTMTLTIDYDANPTYGKSTRNDVPTVYLKSDNSVSKSISITQYQRFMDYVGYTFKCLYTWDGGSVTGQVKCNFLPQIDCPTAAQNGVSTNIVKSAYNTYDVTYTVGLNEDDEIRIVPSYIRDPMYPDEKYITVNLVSYPMIPDGDYYISREYTDGGTLENGCYPWYAAGYNLDNNKMSGYLVNYDDKTLDYTNTANVVPLTFTRIEGSNDYRISYKNGNTTLYLYFGEQRGNGTYYVQTSTEIQYIDGKDASRWSVLPNGSFCAILNHCKADMEAHTGSYRMYVGTNGFMLVESDYVSETYSWAIPRFGDFWYYEGGVNLVTTSGSVLPVDRNDY